MIVNNWCRGKDSVDRLPSRWDDFIILEKTEHLTDKKWDNVNKAPYMLITEVKPEKILKSLK